MSLPQTLEGCTEVIEVFGTAELVELAEHDRRQVRPRGGRRRQCLVKESYGRRRAHRIARVMCDRSGEDLYAYACPHCGRWHVGHRPTGGND